MPEPPKDLESFHFVELDIKKFEKLNEPLNATK